MKKVTIKKEFDRKDHDLQVLQDDDAVYFCDGGVPGWKRGSGKTFGVAVPLGETWEVLFFVGTGCI